MLADPFFNPKASLFELKINFFVQIAPLRLQLTIFLIDYSFFFLI